MNNFCNTEHYSSVEDYTLYMEDTQNQAARYHKGRVETSDFKTWTEGGINIKITKY